ncbi:hypothetical protein [Bradyrhizobium macuxiense]|uniref:hypothetical protein n=1 Tax=Bradyrhizobium macuxiense TaxID=1755647 RepID=UPI0010A96C15|nr:hypothetical protein [Bradyrhizobium macuxiense]
MSTGIPACAARHFDPHDKSCSASLSHDIIATTAAVCCVPLKISDAAIASSDANSYITAAYS